MAQIKAGFECRTLKAPCRTSHNPLPRSLGLWEVVMVRFFSVGLVDTGSADFLCACNIRLCSMGNPEHPRAWEIEDKQRDKEGEASWLTCEW